MLSRYVSLLRTPSSVQQSSATPASSIYVYVRIVVSCVSSLILVSEFLLTKLCNLFTWYLVVFFVVLVHILGWRVSCFLVLGTLALDLPTFDFCFLSASRSVTTEFVPLYEKGVLPMRLVRRTG